MNLTEQQIEILQACENVDEVIAKLGEWGIVLSDADVESLRALDDFTEINMDDLDSVSGGCGTPSGASGNGEYSKTGRCPGCDSIDNSTSKGQGYSHEYFHCNACNLDWYMDA